MHSIQINAATCIHFISDLIFLVLMHATFEPQKRRTDDRMILNGIVHAIELALMKEGMNIKNHFSKIHQLVHVTIMRVHRKLVRLLCHVSLNPNTFIRKLKNKFPKHENF